MAWDLSCGCKIKRATAVPRKEMCGNYANGVKIIKFIKLKQSRLFRRRKNACLNFLQTVKSRVNIDDFVKDFL